MDASHGIDTDSVVQDEAAARRRAALVCERYGPRAIVEEFVDGRELNVAVALGRVLPLAEVDWRLPEGVPRVLGYAEKWDEESEAYARTSIVCPARIDDALASRVRAVALAAFDAVGARDYARVDVRVDARGEPFVLEVNPNPDISPGAGLARAARVAGWSYDDFIQRIVQVAEERAKAPAARAEGS
jgi:D-alanine-D-alanine ligase